MFIFLMLQTAVVDLPPTDSHVLATQTGQNPQIGEARTVSAGESILETFRFATERSITLVEPLEFPVGGQVFRAKAGQATSRSMSKAAVKVCFEDISIFWKDGSPTIDQGCLLDDDGNGTFDRWSRDLIGKARPLAEPAKWTVTDVVRVHPEGNFKRTFIFLGSASDTLRISYREFSNDMARPAFTEDFSFPLDKSFPQQVAFKGHVMTVLGISGLGLKYRLDK